MIDITATSPAIEELWRSHADELIRFATVLVGPSDASDIVADSFLAAAPIAVGPGVANKRAYLFRAVSNQARRLHRARERRWIRDLSAVAAEVTITSESPIDVRRAVASLSLDQRTVVYLAYWEDLPERAIADLLQVSSTTQLDQTGGHQMGDGPSYHWSSNVTDPDGRQFNLTVSDSVRFPRLVDGEEVDINGIVGVTFQGDVSWPIDSTHIGTVTEFGTTETAGVVALALQLTTMTVSTLPGMTPSDPTVTPDSDAAFTGNVHDVAWSASATPDEIRFVVAGTSAETYGGDAGYRLANHPTQVTAMGSNLCVLIAGYVADPQTTVNLILSDGTTIGLPTQALEDGERWYGACLPYELDAVAVEIDRPNEPQPDRYVLNSPFIQPSFGSIDLLEA